MFRLEYPFNIVDPESVARAAVESRIAATSNHHNHVSGSRVRLSPAHLLDIDHLTLRVLSLEPLARGKESHIILEERFILDVAVMDVETITVYPFRDRLRETLAGSAHTLGVDVALLVFPALLQQHVYLRLIVALHPFLFGCASSLDYSVLIAHLGLKVKHKSLRSASERDAHIDGCIRVLCAADRLDHLTEEERAIDADLDVHHTHHADSLKTRVEARAIAMAALFGIGRASGLVDAGRGSVCVGDAPDSLLEIICLVGADSVGRTEHIESFSFAAEERTLLDVADAPVLHVAETDGLYFLLRRNGDDQESEDSEYNCFFHYLTGFTNGVLSSLSQPWRIDSG